MTEDRYNALWILAPLTGTLVAFTGGMLFRGWFAADFGLARHDSILVAGFVGAVLVSIAVIGGYLGALKEKIAPPVLFVVFAGLLVTFFCALSVGSVIDALSGNRQAYILAALSALSAVFFGVMLKRKFMRGRLKRGQTLHFVIRTQRAAAKNGHATTRDRIPLPQKSRLIFKPA